MSDGNRFLDKNYTQLEKLIVCMLIIEKLTVKETAKVLEVEEFMVRRLFKKTIKRILG